MNKKVLINLSKIISKYFYDDSYDLNDAADAFNAEFSTMNIDEILNDGKNYAHTQSGNDKNITIFINIFALFILNIDDVEELQNSIRKHELVGALFGGTLVLLKGESQSLSLKTKIRPTDNRNNLIYIKNGTRLEPLKSIVLAKFFEMLFLLNDKSVEHLILNDQSDILLTLIANDYLSVKLSEELEEKILSGEDEFKKDLILYIKYKPIENVYTEMQVIKRNTEIFPEEKINNNNLKKLKKELVESYVDFESRLERLPAYEQVSFVINLLLPPYKPVPNCIIQMVFKDDLFEAFIQVFKEKLKYFYHVLELIFLACNQNQDKLSKEQKDTLESTIAALQVDYIKNDYLLNWEANISLIEFIGDFLSPVNIRTLIQGLTSIQEKLMSNDLDRLIRFEYYIKDSTKDDYITRLINKLSKKSSNKI